MSGFRNFFYDSWEIVFGDGSPRTPEEYSDRIRRRLAVIGMTLLGGESIFHEQLLSAYDDEESPNTPEDLEEKAVLEILYHELATEKEKMHFCEKG